jgi:hypothetical protein
MDGNSSIPEHRLWSGGGHDQIFLGVLQRVFDVIKVSLLLLVFYF